MEKVELKTGEEFRFEVSSETKGGISIELISGSCELFGVELAIDRKYTFFSGKLALYTYYGCVLQLHQSIQDSYISEETPMISYLNLHSQMEQRREQAMYHGTAGPRIMVVGPVDVGKTSLCKILVNYALRLGRKPTVVDLDVAQSMLSVPGTVSASPLDITSLSVVDGFVLTTPLTYYFGSNNLGDNPALFKNIVDQLASAVDARMKNDQDANASGVVINTNGWVEGMGYKLLLHCVHAFKVDIVISLGQDRLYSTIKRDMSPMANCTVVKMNRSGGVVNRNKATRRKLRMQMIREYFYGTPYGESGVGTLSPSATEIAFGDVELYRIIDMNMSDAMLPVGQTALRKLEVVKVAITMDLCHSIVSIAHDQPNYVATKADDVDFLLQCASAGYLYMIHSKEVNMKTEKFTVLAPCPGPLPSKYLVCGDIKWIE